jgi:hypothetical protein
VDDAEGAEGAVCTAATDVDATESGEVWTTGRELTGTVVAGIGVTETGRGSTAGSSEATNVVAAGNEYARGTDDEEPPSTTLCRPTGSLPDVVPELLAVGGCGKLTW